MSERMYSVIVERSKKSALIYGPTNWEKTLANMRVLKERGLNPIARTKANGITDDLKLEDLEEIYADWLTESV